MKEIEDPPLKFWSNPRASEIIIDKLNEIVRKCNELEKSLGDTDEFIAQVDHSVEAIERIVFEQVQEMDS